MSAVEKRPIPAHTLLDQYSTNGAYADCYSTEISGKVSFPDFVFSFYTSPLFKLERLILRLTVSKPSRDTQARQLANGEIEKFAAWRVENRSENEILMCDYLGRTRSWLMVLPVNSAHGDRTRLYFGSAIVPTQNSKTGELSLEFGFKALLGFHKVYSLLLLYSAKSNIKWGKYMLENYQKANK